MRRSIHFFVMAIAIGLVVGAATQSAHATISASGNYTATSGAPYNGTDNPWSTNNLVVGDSAPASVTVNGGYTVSNTGTGTIANSAAASTSSVTITGTGSKWTNASSLYVGAMGTGTLDVTSGGTLVSSFVNYLGNNIGSNGTVNVGGGSGASKWMLGIVYVGWQGNGTLNITGKFGIWTNPIGYAVTINYAYTGTDALGRIGDGNDLAVTVKSLSAVPEPTTVIVWGLVLVSLAVCSKQLRKIAA